MLLWPSPAAGHSIKCFTPDSVFKGLEQQYQERVEGYGPSEANELWQIWVAEDGSWTLVVLGDGKACVMAYGKNWRWAPPTEGTVL